MGKTLITGANGQLGSEITRLVNTDSNFILTDIDTLDLCGDEVEDFIVQNQITTIVNCAAYTNVDRAEDIEEEEAYLLNADAVENLANICLKHDIYLVHLSTDYVFNGRKPSPYFETDYSHPLSVYGKSKRAGEKAIQKSGCKSIIIRTSWLYSIYGKNFVKKMIEIAEDEFFVNVVEDQKGSPTYAKDLAQAILDILPQLEETVRYGEIFHYANEGQCNWFEFATKIMTVGRFECTPEPIISSDFPSKTQRPANSTLETSHIKKVFGLNIPTWEKSLIKMIKEYKLIEKQETNA